MKNKHLCLIVLILFSKNAIASSNLDSLKLSERELPSKTIVFMTKQSSRTHSSHQLFKEVCRLMGESCKKGKRFFVNRAEVLQAIPEMHLDSGTQKIRTPTAPNRLISSVQKRLDSSAATNAVIMDCKHSRDLGTVSNCGLYLYNGDRKSVVASSVRYFVVPISDPSKWAEPIYSSFLDGLQANERLKEQKALDDFYRNNDNETEESAKFGLGLDLGFLVTRSKDWKLVPKGTLTGLRSYDLGSLGLYVTYAAANRTVADESKNVRAVGAGLEALLRAHAMRALVWELGFLGGWEQLDFSSARASAKAHLLHLGVRPALWFEATNSFKLGFGLLCGYRTPLVADANFEKQNMANLISGFGFEPAFRMELTF